MKLSARIAALDLAPAQRRRIRDELVRVARSDGHIRPEETRLVDRLVPLTVDLKVPPASLDSLWRQGELLITACIYVAVADGEYGVEEARAVSALAHQLGLSARRLGELEQNTFAELAARARQ
ncbi:MAG: hypothetical protein GXP62_16060 [Oligoflexia bacterium]|nr:hypothetical protein [Oligoflexia bacterium]